VVMGRVDYAAQSNEQLSFKKGDHIRVLGESYNGWFKGRLESTYDEGIVPATYVEPVKVAGVASNPVAASDGNVSPREGALIVLIVKCLRDFDSKDASYLSFKQHDRVEVLEDKDAKLYKARAKGKIGFVTKDMVEEDRGYTIRNATEKKEQTRGQFRAAREKEIGARKEKMSVMNSELDALKAEQERLQKERELIAQQQEAKREHRQNRKMSSFSERLAVKQQSAKSKDKGVAEDPGPQREKDEVAAPKKGGSARVRSASAAVPVNNAKAASTQASPVSLPSSNGSSKTGFFGKKIK